MAYSEKEQQVIAWRKEALVKAGWEPSMALEISLDHKIDLRVAESAIKCGDPHQALYLLSLTDEPNNK
jgi:hypothetical protein